MSILPAMSLLSELASPATAPATPSPTVVQLLAPLAFFAAVAVAIIVLAKQLGWFSPARWSPPRCATPGEAGRLWIAAAMIVFAAIAVPTMLVHGRAHDASTTVPATPTPASDAFATLVTTGTYVAVVLAAIGVHLVFGLRPASSAIGLRSDRPRGRDAWVVLLGVPFAIVLTTATLELTQLGYVLIGFRQPSAHAMLLLMQRNERTPWVLALTIVNATLLAPAAEELLFRGHLQTALTSLFPRRWSAIVITSGLFAAMHEPWMIPPIFVLSLVIGYLYERTGNLWVAIATHVAFNATSTTLFLISRGAAG